MHNQTKEKWLITISNLTKGTGVFVAAIDFEFDVLLKAMWSTEIILGAQTLTKTVMADCTYLECVRMGSIKDVIAFKWIPAHLATFDEIRDSAQACGNVFCVKRCAGYGCVCVSGECK